MATSGSNSLAAGAAPTLGRSFEGNQIKTIRDRTKEHLPMVLLTLLSIVQALALELLWGYIRVSDYLFELSWTALLSWVQIGTNFMGIIVIWIVYASIAMRFRWIPDTSDSVYPFVVGLLEFVLIETLAPQFIGWWFICLAMVFALMTWVTHRKMRRARQDPENEEFFAHFEPATARDFYPAIVIVIGFFLAGVYLLSTDHRGYLTFVAVIAAFAVLVRQLIVAAGFWQMSISDDPAAK